MTFETDSDAEREDARLREEHMLLVRNEIKCWRCGKQLIMKPFYEVAIVKRPTRDRLMDHRREDPVRYAPICIDCAENKAL